MVAFALPPTASPNHEQRMCVHAVAAELLARVLVRREDRAGGNLLDEVAHLARAAEMADREGESGVARAIRLAAELIQRAVAQDVSERFAPSHGNGG